MNAKPDPGYQDWLRRQRALRAASQRDLARELQRYLQDVAPIDAAAAAELQRAVYGDRRSR